VTGSISGFYYHFNDFISLQPSGALDPDDSLPIYDYQPIGATFYGGEIETTFHLWEAVPATPATGSKSPPATPARESKLDLILGVDYVHAEDRDTGEPIPRIAPLRTRVALDYSIGKFDARLEGLIAAAQHRHADYELPTNGYFLLNASIGYDLDIGDLATTVYLKGVNLTNEEARQSTSFLKDIAPMPGRGVVLGLRAEF
jgi:iron complex outermembrane receptor protein